MAARSRIRRVAKWMGLCVCLIILASWGMSIRRALSFYHRVWRLSLAGSTVSVLVATKGPYFDDLSEKYRLRGAMWYSYAIRPYASSDYGLTWPYLLKCGPTREALETVIPLWLLLLVSAIPTAILFRRDCRRIGPGHCPKCGYDLTKNESGVCPECGVKIQGQTTLIVPPSRGPTVE